MVNKYSYDVETLINKLNSRLARGPSPTSPVSYLVGLIPPRSLTPTSQVAGAPR
ncbi:hypothetical protein Scep_005496 [Stephania cephalantha]|uniref:Uncharacterized protein n=1 Tax=Stephania cephalantha TaxID=152367 RepID=A0AAP0KUG4_9MAGN